MKTKKKTPKKIKMDLESVIGKGKGTVEETKRGKGRPKNKVKKIQCPFYLPENIAQAIDENCMGNKSVFAEKIFREYFNSKGIKY
ncbi:MAG: hypothetical protein BA871_14455 [Desulfuromonadales bacterium C00003096]|jgi:hypothetical protein|nr:MAG: hypothetical protein BA871_14455 [Desulfuromonadales bacterium C00003096]